MLRSPRLLSPRLISFLLVLIAFLVVSCSQQQRIDPADTWKYADLRLLSPPDASSEPGDFIAGYTRLAGSDLQLRFDFLNMEGYLENDYYVALDYQPGGSVALPIDTTAGIAWDSLLYIPAVGIPRFITPEDNQDGINPPENLNIPGEPIPRIVRNPWQDFILVAINRTSLPILSRGVNIQAFSSPPGTTKTRDVIGPFNSNDYQAGKTPLLLTFWDTFPAYSPSQALRKWDGAHTGPKGERHGLGILLGNLHRFAVPAVLLDLRNPASLLALDHLEMLPRVIELLENKLLILPDSLPGSPTYPVFPDGLPSAAVDYYLDHANKISRQFGIPHSDILYLPRTGVSLPGYGLYFAPENPSSQFPPFISLPDQAADEPQTTPDGLSLTARRLLITNALARTSNPDFFNILLLGGSLQESNFGDPAASSAALSYIANHPWIDPINQDDLRALPPGAEFQYLPGSTQAINTDRFSPSPLLGTLPDPQSSNYPGKQAWAAAFSLYSTLPPETDELAQLRGVYSGQPAILSAAGRWSDNPHTARDCENDIDWDGYPECVLASEYQFVVIDPLGARLIVYLYKNKSGDHMVVAPSNHFIVGLGDQSTWMMDAGDGADPVGIHGAFADSSPYWPLYSYSTEGDGITFSSPDGMIEKNFSLQNAGLSVKYSTQNQITGRIPLAIDPWNRFSPGWSENLKYSPIDMGYQFSLRDKPIVEVISDMPMDLYSFTDSKELLGVPEDPNYDYPPGHYLPFPLSVLEYHAQGEFTFQFKPAW